MLLNCFNKFKLTHQICCEIIIVSVVHMIITLSFIAMSISLVFLFAYKDTISHLDSQEFAEMTSIGNLLENSQMILESSYQDYAALLSIMYNVTSNRAITGTIIDNSKLKVVNFSPNEVYEEASTILHWRKDSKQINSTTKSILEDMSMYLSQMHNQKIFGYKDKANEYYNQILFIDVKNEYVCAYPGNLSDFNTNLDFEMIKDYVIERIAAKVNQTTALSNVFPNNLLYSNLFEFPVYDESTPFPELYLTKDQIKILSFAIVKDDYNSSPLQLAFSKVFFVIGKKSSVNIIYDSIIDTTNNIFLLKSKYYFPYELFNKELCLYIMNLNIKDDEINFDQNDLANLNYLEDCFSTKIAEVYESNPRYKNITYRNLFLYSMKLSDQSNFKIDTMPPTEAENNNNSTPTQLIQLAEQKLFQDNATAFNQTINNRLMINGKIFKIKKFYSPFALSNLISYYYPINNIYLNLLIKSEGSNENLSCDIHTRMTAILINCIIWSYILMAVILLFIGIRLNTVTKGIKKILDRINNLISGNPFKESDNENIHEFNILIEMIDKMIKGDLNLKQTQNQKEEIRFKFDIERFNKEFTFVDSNIVVKEDDILSLIDKSNESFELLNQPIKRIKNDSFLQESDLFKGIVAKMIDNDDDNSNSNRRQSKEIENKGQENDNSAIDSFLVSNRSLQYDKNALYKEGLEISMEIQEACLFFK